MPRQEPNMRVMRREDLDAVAHDLIDQFLTNMKTVGVSKVYTLVNWDDFKLEHFFASHRFQPSKRVNLELQLP